MTKTCSRCKLEKPLDQFGSHLRMADGLRSACKDCERKPPRTGVCGWCGEDFLYATRGPSRHLCADCEEVAGWCHTCKTAKPADEFYKQKSSRTGRSYACRACVLAHSASLPGVRSRKASSVRSRYGLTLEQYESYLEAAEGTCPCCGKTDRKKMCLDHDHETGAIRAIICYSCNTGIGHLGDTVEGLMKAVAYLERHKP